MKILIQDYTSTLSTEPMYLNTCLQMTKVVQSNIWNTSSISTFDALDSSSPDILLCHYMTPVLNDILKYLSKNKKIELIVNITGAQDSYLDILENILDKNSVTCPFFISNLHQLIFTPKCKKKVVNLLPAVDLFLPKQNLPEFNIETAILSDSKEFADKHTNKLKCYHKLGIGTQDQYFDFNVNAGSMTSLYDKYKKIILAADLSVTFSQLFFDAVFKSKKVVLKTNDEQKSSQVLADLFDSNEDDEDIATAIKNQIKTKHTCFNRAASLMEALKVNNIAKVLNQISDVYFG